MPGEEALLLCCCDVEEPPTECFYIANRCAETPGTPDQVAIECSTVDPFLTGVITVKLSGLPGICYTVDLDNPVAQQGSLPLSTIVSVLPNCVTCASCLCPTCAMIPSSVAISVNWTPGNSTSLCRAPLPSLTLIAQAMPGLPGFGPCRYFHDPALCVFSPPLNILNCPSRWFVGINCQNSSPAPPGFKRWSFAFSVDWAQTSGGACISTTDCFICAASTLNGFIDVPCFEAPLGAVTITSGNALPATVTIS